MRCTFGSPRHTELKSLLKWWGEDPMMGQEQGESLGARLRRTMAGGHEADEEWQEGMEERMAREGPCRV